MPKPVLKIARENASGMATPKQIDYLMNLLNANGVDNCVQRAAWCSLRFERAIGYLDELTKQEASRLIDELTGEDL